MFGMVLVIYVGHVSFSTGSSFFVSQISFRGDRALSSSKIKKPGHGAPRSWHASYPSLSLRYKYIYIYILPGTTYDQIFYNKGREGGG